jgi:hypothetical protein
MPIVSSRMSQNCFFPLSRRGGRWALYLPMYLHAYVVLPRTATHYQATITLTYGITEMTTTINKEGSLGSLPQDCRRNILSYISPTELYTSYAATPRFCHADSLDDQLPQTTCGEFHITGRGETEINMESLLQRISHPSFLNA